MLLAIDVGNTQTVLGIFNEATLVRMWRIKTDQNQTVDELRVCIEGLFRCDGVDAMSIEGAVLGTVVPRCKRIWSAAVAEMFDVELVDVDAEMATCLLDTSSYDGTLGADRIADAVAARQEYGAPVVVVDFGTATNFEVIDKDGAFVGGAIAPGVETSMRALLGGTAQLSQVDLTVPGDFLGMGTKQAIQIGVVQGEAARVEGLVRGIWSQLGYETPVVFTGGLSEIMGEMCKIATNVDAKLTLKGLQLLFLASSC